MPPRPTKFRVADGEDVGSAQPSQHLGKTRPLRGRDEEDVHLRRVRRVSEPSHRKGPAEDGLAGDGLVEYGPEGIVAEDADDERRARLGVRPLHELREVVQERRLHLVFGGRGELGRARRRSGQRGQRGRDEGGGHVFH
jgi:hypothetical protein